MGPLWWLTRDGDIDCLELYERHYSAYKYKDGRHLSSELIRQADAIADCLWPHCRHYTYVDAKAVNSSNPGFCFISAGWRRCSERTKKRGLLILERPAATGQ